jgi:hypothetical protein
MSKKFVREPRHHRWSWSTASGRPCEDHGAEGEPYSAPAARAAEPNAAFLCNCACIMLCRIR